jgi:hypothetical protein
VALISNPTSGQNARHGLLGRIGDLLRAHPRVAHLQASSFDGIVAAARQVADGDTEIVAVNGGDGTVQAVLTGLLRAAGERLPVLAVLRGGTTNTTAHNLGYGRRPLPALQRLLTGSAGGVLAGTVERHAVVRADLDGGPQYAMMFGAGAVYHGIVFARGQIESRGVHGQLGAGLALATFLAKIFTGGGGKLFPPLAAAIRVDGEPLPPASYFGILTSTIDRQFLGISPYWGTGPGRLRLSALHYRPRHLARAIVPALRGRPSPLLRPELGYRSLNADEVELTFDSGFTLDGELFPPPPRPLRLALSGRQAAYFLRAPA